MLFLCTAGGPEFMLFRTAGGPENSGTHNLAIYKLKKHPIQDAFSLYRGWSRTFGRTHNLAIYKLKKHPIQDAFSLYRGWSRTFGRTHNLAIFKLKKASYSGCFFLCTAGGPEHSGEPTILQFIN
jgi:hypothetical protein